MKQRKLNRKKVAFIIIVALIFILPLVAINKTVMQIASTIRTGITSNKDSDTTKTAKTSIPPGSDWSMYLHDLQRTAATDDRALSTTNASQLSKLWTFKTGGTIAASAAVVDGTVYVGSWDGYEYALDQMTGTLKWKTFLGVTHPRAGCDPPTAGVTSSAAVQNNVLYVGGGDSYWYALNAKTGAILWKVFTGDNSATGGHYNWSSPLLYNGYAYIGVASEGDCPLVQGQLLQVSLSTHQITNHFNMVPDGQIGGGVWTSPSIDPATNSIFMSTGTRSIESQQLAQAVVVLDASTLALKSSWPLPEAEAIGDSDFDTTPILFNDAHGTPLVAAINKNGYLYVFNRNNVHQGPVWKQLIAIAGMCPVCELSSVSSNTFAQDTLYVAAGDSKIDGQTFRGSVEALDPTTGTFLWNHGSIDGPVIGALAYANGLIVDGGGTDVEVLDATTGARLYSYNTNNQIYAAPIVSHGQIFVGTTDGAMYAFGINARASNSSGACLKGWSCQDIGNPIISGTAKSSGKTISVTAGGTGINHTTDQLHLVSKKVSGNTQISARLVSQQIIGVGGNGQKGLIMRQSSDPSSPYYGAFLTTNIGLEVQYRTSFGGDTVQDIQLPNATLPLYLKIQRVGDQFHTEGSTDGGTYVIIPGSTVNMVMPSTLNTGLAVSSGNNATMATVTYSNISFDAVKSNSYLLTSPAVCPTEWNCNDVGNPALIGTHSFSNDVWTIQGAGSDIWNAEDQFHYVWQNMVGHRTMSARVVSLKPALFHSKIGIMVRQNLQPDSAYYAIFVEPQQDGTMQISVEVRDTEGIISRQLTSMNGPITTPVSLKIVTVGTTISAYMSQDGMKWGLINGSALTMNPAHDAPGQTLTLDTGTALVGMAISSHDVNTLVSAVLDEVALQ
ncbi:MAG TPA: PQQ-binding-like beta-propeller repeat protein [Ktedonobacteraceae bacterium]|jgi:outer membrane protein assembly factor BamB